MQVHSSDELVSRLVEATNSSAQEPHREGHQHEADERISARKDRKRHVERGMAFAGFKSLQDHIKTKEYQKCKCIRDMARADHIAAQAPGGIDND